ncbi:MAG: pyruvate flavodoxin/ferredoxin oxidoreductase protein [Oscillospiraceae bacterium]|jgi:2-oxoglutarate ferredoxin oxidoreductase subunit alpha|nr:pyruvate flavodoxin/ferredoxin oxidoreductase protein [Oscillospiraceae bacterium]
MSKKFLMKGNEVIAEAAIRSGCTMFFGYPITPQTEVAAYMSKRLPEIGGVYLQAESEVSAINMVLGAASAGRRVMTSSSSPGISLKSEGISYIAASDLPCVIINVQRAGPGLGGIQPSQADYFQATKGLGHGDFHLMVFAPSSVQEIADLIKTAFDLSDKYRVPSLILADGIMGQMMEPVSFSEEESTDQPDKGWATSGHDNKRAPNIVNSLYLTPDELEKTVIERYQRYDVIAQNEVLFEKYLTEDADIIVVAYGASSRISKSVINTAREKGIKVGILRPITLWPFPTQAIKELCKTAKSFLCVEMSMGQMVEDVRLAVEGVRPVSFYGRTGGNTPRPEDILHKIEQLNEEEK